MYSFDIFDTLITRRTAEPKGIFMLMQEKIQENGEYSTFLAGNFYELRVGAEELARLYANENRKQEITLDDIYKALATAACITEKEKEQLKRLELETEYKNVLGIFRNINLVKELRAKGENIVLISDMYLGKEDIRRMLCRVDAVFRDIPLYVSSEYGKTKSGGLFQVVKKCEKAEISGWVHYGDNIGADIESASKLGIRAVQYLPEHCREYEYPGKSVFHQASIGISKYVRSLGEMGVAGEIGCSLAGPVLYPYVSWVIRESVRRRIDRLYFVARDGWILKQIAEMIIQAGKYPIQTFYIYGSRKVWRLPSYEGGQEDFERILKWSDMGEVLTMDDLAAVFQIKPEALSPFLPESCQRMEGRQRISKIQRENICSQLRENKEFRRYLVESQIEKKSLAVRYLQQEIDTSGGRFAFVELSGTGLTQKCLARLIGSFYKGYIHNFFLKLDSIQEKEQCVFLNFFPSNIQGIYMLELLCRAPHGQTEGYLEKGGRIHPVLEQVEGKKIKEYHLAEYRDAVLNYVRYMEETAVENKFKYDIKLDIVREYMEAIAVNPPERIGEYFCHMPFSASGRENGIMEYAPSISSKQLRKIYFWGDGSNVREVYQGCALDYALAVSDKAARYKAKCLKYRKTKVGKWITGWNRYLQIHLKPGIDFFCPWELLQGKIVIYGAGKVGRDYVKQAKQRYAKCSSLLWVDKDYEKLQAGGLDVKSPEEISRYSFDRVIIAIHNTEIRQEVWERLRGMGIEAEKIYYG